MSLADLLEPAVDERGLRLPVARAAYVLRDNDLGDITAAAPALYPHQWSWDAAFVAIGLARLSVPRAIAELRSLLNAQWSTGMIPHIVFSDQPGYFPGPEMWRSSQVPTAPKHVETSGICQPPVHAIALSRILALAHERGGRDAEQADDFAETSFDGWFAWHRWLATARDPEGTGVLEIHHGWESGMDNSPRWDLPYANITPDERLLPYQRTDLDHVADVSQRPTHREYDRYIWLVQQLRSIGYDDQLALSTVDFRVADVFMTALFARANDCLAEVGEALGRREQATQLRAWAARSRAGLLTTVDATTGLARDRDLRTGQYLSAQTVAGFAPLIAGVDDPDLVAHQLDVFQGERWCGNPALKYPLPPSTPPGEPGFIAESYWRGPQWPFLNGLFVWALSTTGHDEVARTVARASVAQLSDGVFAEYYDPFTSAPLGSGDQSWSASTLLDLVL